MRGRPFTKGQIPWNYNRVEIKCEFCGKMFKVSPNRKNTAKHCSRQCHNTAISRNWNHEGSLNPAWKGGIQTYRRKKGKACQRCGSIKYLIVHHKDRNRYNNDTENLETICRSCHAKEHGVIKNITSSSFYQQRPSSET